MTDPVTGADLSTPALRNAFQQESLALIQESQRWCGELYDYIPFHPFKWRALKQKSEARNAEVNRRNTLIESLL